jgi:hypothetical protein
MGPAIKAGLRWPSEATNGYMRQLLATTNNSDSAVMCAFKRHPAFPSFQLSVEYVHRGQDVSCTSAPQKAKKMTSKKQKILM